MELGYKLGPVPITGDNMSSLFMSGNAVTSKYSKHIDIRYHYIRELVDAKKVEVQFIEGTNNSADMFTKNLAAPQFLKFRKLLGLEFYSSKL